VTALLLGLHLALAPVIALVHALSSSHRYCAEHDAFEHVSGPEAAPSETRERSVRAAVPAAEAAHDDCALVRPCSAATTTLTAPAQAAPDEQRCARVLAVDQTLAPPIAILANAPKASPPVV
jgi:hypothetical protein